MHYWRICKALLSKKVMYSVLDFNAHPYLMGLNWTLHLPLTCYCFIPLLNNALVGLVFVLKTNRFNDQLLLLLVIWYPCSIDGSCLFSSNVAGCIRCWSPPRYAGAAPKSEPKGGYCWMVFIQPPLFYFLWLLLKLFSSVFFLKLHALTKKWKNAVL